MKRDFFTWKFIGTVAGKNILRIVKSIYTLFLLIFTTIALAFYNVIMLLWGVIKAIGRNIVTGIDNNPRWSVVIELVLTLLAIFAMFVHYKIEGKMYSKKIDSLMMVNDTLKTYSMYDIGYSKGYKDGNKGTLRALGKE